MIEFRTGHSVYYLDNNRFTIRGGKLGRELWGVTGWRINVGAEAIINLARGEQLVTGTVREAKQY